MINEVGIALLHHWFLPQRSAPLAITGSEVLGVVPLKVTDTLLDEFHRLADRHELTLVGSPCQKRLERS